MEGRILSWIKTQTKTQRRTQKKTARRMRTELNSLRSTALNQASSLITIVTNSPITTQINVTNQ